MRVYLNSTANLGDFLNALPVLSGLYKSIGRFDFVMRNDMAKFKGLREFMFYQNIFSAVYFDDEIDKIQLYGNSIILSSWTREDQNNPNRPIETCRYENWLKDNYRANFVVDDEFVLRVPDLDIEIPDMIHGGDRWNGPDIDKRRESWTLSRFKDILFLNYENTMLENAYIIKNCKGPFISTFTGISVIADLLKKDQIILWGEDIRDWDNKPIEYSFRKHYYGDRNSKLMYIDDFEKSRNDRND